MDKTKTKICGKCKNEYPKDTNYFFRRLIKQKLASGKIATYDSFRSDCKKCHAEYIRKRHVEKRCEEMGCEIEDYRDNWIKQLIKTKTKYPEISHLTEGVKNTLRKWIDRGYKFTTYEQFRLDVRKNHSKKMRKYDYGDCDFVPQIENNRRGIKNLTNAYIAMCLGSKVTDVPQCLIENRRLIIKLKRELKNNNVKIR